MENNRLSQQQASGDTGSLRRLDAPDWKHLSELNEELRTIAPVFQKLDATRSPSPSAQEWKSFTQKLDQRLEETKAPVFQTLKDRISTSDGFISRWFWIIIAMLALALLGAILAASLSDSTLQFTQAESLPRQELIMIKPAATQTTPFGTDKSTSA